MLNRKNLHLAGGTLLLGLCSVHCTPRAEKGPAWPEKPSPSYPQPEDASAPDVQAEKWEEPAPAETATPQSSQLSKEYSGTKSLDTLRGQASYYADSLAGNHTANGDIYDPNIFTAAHKKLKFGTIVRVIREDTGAVTYVRINDRGPFGSATRIIDLSKAAAKELDMMKAGVVSVRVEVVEIPAKK